MSSPRRDFLKELLAVGTLPGLIASPGFGRSMDALLDQDNAKNINPDLDAKAYSFWSDFLSSDAEPIVGANGQRRGGGSPRPDDVQPVFMRYGPEGFKNAAELDISKLVSAGDVMVGVNTSAVKLAEEDQRTLQRLQNAQIRVDVAQKTAILPILEAMAYTVVGGMRTGQGEIASKSKSKTAKKAPPTVQSISSSSDAAWQKMQNIPLPAGEGRWALNLEAQKKDSLFCKVLQNVVKMSGLFMPMLGFPGIALSALNSFNTLYGVLHAGTIPIIKGNPVRVFATQEAVQRTGAPGSVTGILLQSGTYILIPAKQSPPVDQLKNLSVIQGRLVPPKTAVADLDEAAADTLKGVTYATFDVEVTSTTLFTGAAKKSG
ncbi:MAG: hypothetical protein ABSE79_01630 [Terriglobia bacterium]|jgi:hypothetical protein